MIVNVVNSKVIASDRLIFSIGTEKLDEIWLDRYKGKGLRTNDFQEEEILFNFEEGICVQKYGKEHGKIPSS